MASIRTARAPAVDRTSGPARLRARAFVQRSAQVQTRSRVATPHRAANRRSARARAAGVGTIQRPDGSTGSVASPGSATAAPNGPVQSWRFSAIGVSPPGRLAHQDGDAQDQKVYRKIPQPPRTDNAD